MNLTEIKGIGEKTKEYFKKLGVHKAEDLLTLFPRDYELFFPPSSIGEVSYSSFAAIRGAFTDELNVRTVKKLKITTGLFKDEVGGSIRASWFNAPYLKNTIRPGKLYVLKGRITHKYGVSEFNQPKVYDADEYINLIGRAYPVYPLTKGLSNALVTKAVRSALSCLDAGYISCEEVLPSALRAKYSLCDKTFSIRNIHFPESDEAYANAVKREAFEEIFLFSLVMIKSGSGRRKEKGLVISRSSRTEEFINKLPFELTGAQKMVSAEISSDMVSGNQMNRLIQGDVGSGKTLLAILALIDTAFAGYQGVLMAPTEVLAKQHFDTVSKFLKDAGIPLNTAHLSGSMSALEKKVVYDALEDGRIDILIGTHAIIQDKVHFKSLGLVVTDEQHRFGIKQRDALAGKGAFPHILAMSATPIPRTMALVLYAGMDVSEVDELPAGRLPIKNAVVDRTYRERAYRFIAKEIRLGRQAYVICPLVEFSEGLDAENVTDYSEMLKGSLGPDISVGMLHGQMSQTKKDEVMASFVSGKIQVLVSTTVIEVGVDVKNATVIMIEDANRFGLATLHQLRGRVGRSDAQSYCILVSGSNSKVSKERLNILGSTNNGFEIAEKDLEMRGPGEFSGIRQSGAISFKCFDIMRDASIAVQAIDAAKRVLSGDIVLSPWEKQIIKESTSDLMENIVL